MKNLLWALPLAALATAGEAQQNVRPPIANYWMSVETAGGMNIPGMGAGGGFGGVIAGAMGAGRQMQGGKRMVLQLGSQRDASPPRADHFIPQGMSMGDSLPLLGTPTTTRTPQEREPYEMPERRNARLLIYWGCGATARAGQPVVIDTARLGAGGAGFAARTVARGTPPGAGASRGYGHWPNQQDGKAVPESASLIGSHSIKGNYTPDIQFSLAQDFMERVQLSAADQGGAVNLQWNSIPAATGYFAMATSMQGEDMVFWSSSEVQEMGGSLLDYVPPSEAARLIRERVVMSPQTTECTVPAEVAKGGTGMVQFIAYGPEANFAHPPRPADPRAVWAPEWAVKVRYKSTGMAMLGAQERGGARGRQTTRGQPDAPADDTGAQAPAPSAPNPVREGINILRGIFGR